MSPVPTHRVPCPQLNGSCHISCLHTSCPLSPAHGATSRPLSPHVASPVPSSRGHILGRGVGSPLSSRGGVTPRVPWVTAPCPQLRGRVPSLRSHRRAVSRGLGVLAGGDLIPCPTSRALGGGFVPCPAYPAMPPRPRREPRDGQHEPDLRFRGGGEGQVHGADVRALQRGLRVAAAGPVHQRQSAGEGRPRAGGAAGGPHRPLGVGATPSLVGFGWGVPTIPKELGRSVSLVGFGWGVPTVPGKLG